MSAPFVFPSSISFVYWENTYLIGYTVLLSVCGMYTLESCITVPKESSFAVFMLPFCCWSLLNPTQFWKNVCLLQSSCPSFRNAKEHSLTLFTSLILLPFAVVRQDPTPLEPASRTSAGRSQPIEPGSSFWLDDDGNLSGKQGLFYW